MGKWTIEELSCTESGCDFVAKNPNGLRGHLQWKHNILPPSSGGRQRLEQRAKLVTEDTLEQRISRLEQQLGFAKADTLAHLLAGYAEEPIYETVEHLGSQLTLLEEQQAISADVATEIKAVLAKISKQAAVDATRAAQGLFLAVAVLDTHTHSSKDGGVVINNAFLAKEWQPVRDFVNSELTAKVIAGLFEKQHLGESALAESPQQPKEKEAESEVIQGKTDKPGYKYLKHLGLSVKKD